jgi:hypothetical protein
VSQHADLLNDIETMAGSYTNADRQGVLRSAGRTLLRLERELAEARRCISDATPRWIPVSERLPEPGTFPLICGPKWMLVASYGSNGGSKPYFKAHGAYFEPTHWMPLPEPPK